MDSWDTLGRRRPENTTVFALDGNHHSHHLSCASKKHLEDKEHSNMTHHDTAARPFSKSPTPQSFQSHTSLTLRFLRASTLVLGQHDSHLSLTHAPVFFRDVFSVLKARSHFLAMCMLRFAIKGTHTSSAALLCSAFPNVSCLCGSCGQS